MNLFFATHSKTTYNSLLSVAVISVTVVADMYSVESSAYIDTLALLKASGMSFEKIEIKTQGLNSYPGDFLLLPGLCLRGFH